jgi:hypothetical protein
MYGPLKDHFIPHAGNDYRPHLLQRTAMGVMLALVLITFTAANLQALIWLNVEWLVSAVLPAVVVTETNDERADGAIGPLVRSETLDRAAQLKAEHMAAVGYFAHYAPDGTSPWHWFRATNYRFVHAGENLAVHFNDSREVVRAWMNSPTHRANIMNGNYTEIGIGIAEGEYEGYDTVFVVQLFGTPAAPAPTPVLPDSVTVVSESVSEPAQGASPLVAAAEETIVTEPVTPAPEAQPVPVTLPDTSRTEVEPTPAEIPVTEVVAADPDQLAEQFISTSTNLTPATSAGTTALEPSRVSPLGVLATSPQLVLQVLYSLLAAFVVSILLVSIVVETRRHNPIQIVYSLGLLLVMGGLYALQLVVTSGATII